MSLEDYFERERKKRKEVHRIEDTDTHPYTALFGVIGVFVLTIGLAVFVRILFS